MMSKDFMTPAGARDRTIVMAMLTTMTTILMAST